MCWQSLWTKVAFKPLYRVDIGPGAMPSMGDTEKIGDGETEPFVHVT